jgi:acetyl esterase/lipase
MLKTCHRIVIVTLVLLAVVASPHLARAQSKFVKTTVAYREVDGHKVLADVYRPDDREVRPVIVWIHGGALIMGHRESVMDQIRTLAEQQGFALVSLDYRLAPETKLPDIISDIETAFQWIAQAGAKQYRLDPQRIVVCGGSAGGYLTLVTGYRVQPQPVALVAFWGYGDLTGDWYSQPSPHPRHNPRVITREEALAQTDGTVISDARRRRGNGALLYLYYRQHGAWPAEVSGFDPITEADKFAPFEPIRNVTGDYPPTFLIHGTRDTDVPFDQSRMMAHQLAQHGVPHVLSAIEDGEHGLAGGNPRQIKEGYKAMREFIVRHLEDR